MSLTHPKLDLISARLSSTYFSVSFFWRASMDNRGRWRSWGWGASQPTPDRLDARREGGFAPPAAAHWLVTWQAFTDST